MVGEASPLVLDDISRFRLDELEHAREMEVARAAAAGAASADERPSVVGGVTFEADPTDWLVDAAVGLHLEQSGQLSLRRVELWRSLLFSWAAILFDVLSASFALFLQ